MLLKTSIQLALMTAIFSNSAIANQEQITYECTLNEDDSVSNATFEFNRDSEWASSWDWHANWDTQIPPSFTSPAHIQIGLNNLSNSSVYGTFIGGYTRLTGYTDVTIKTDDENLMLSLIENRNRTFATGYGVYQNHNLSDIKCSVSSKAANSKTVKFAYKRYYWTWIDGKRVCMDDKTGNEVGDIFCKL